MRENVLFISPCGMDILHNLESIVGWRADNDSACGRVDCTLHWNY